MKWYNLDRAYEEYYSKPLPENKKTASNHRSRFKNDIISGAIPLVFTTLHGGELQVEAASIEKFKKQRKAA